MSVFYTHSGNQRAGARQYVGRGKRGDGRTNRQRKTPGTAEEVIDGFGVVVFLIWASVEGVERKE